VNGRNNWLIIGGLLSLAGALIHIGAVIGGPGWYRFFGAGEGIARAAEQGSWVPAAMTLTIAMILSIWAFYAFAGAGIIRRLPLMRTALVLISAIYLARGLLVLHPSAFNRPDLSSDFMIWSSLIVLVFGLSYAVGTWRAWPYLSRRKDA
jgi:hypothetical protein